MYGMRRVSFNSMSYRSFLTFIVKISYDISRAQLMSSTEANVGIVDGI